MGEPKANRLPSFGGDAISEHIGSDPKRSQASSLLADRPVLILKVISGDDRGMTGRFDQASISLGRSWGNDLKLKDLSISGHHGVFARTDEGFIYQDVGSRHGSALQIAGQEFILNGKSRNAPVALKQGGLLKLGRSTIAIEVHQLYASPTEGGASKLQYKHEDVEYLTTMQIPADDLQFQIAHQDPRMDILFRLGRKLNGLTQLNEILALIVDAAFEALPNASLVAVNQIQGGDLKPLMVKNRFRTLGKTPEVVLNQTVLERVIEGGEAILFATDEDGEALDHASDKKSFSTCLCAPLVGQKSSLGVILAETGEEGVPFDHEDLSWFSVLASSAAFALERASLNQAIFRMFEGFVQASVGAIEARDPTTAGHSERVAKYAISLTKAVINSDEGPFYRTSFSPEELTELRYAALLHDFGKVCVREEVLMKSARLSDAEMDQIHHRFQVLRSEYHRKLAHLELQKAVNTANAPSPDSYAAMRANAQQFADDLKKAYRKLDAVRAKWRLSQEEIEEFKAFGRQRLESLDGEQLIFLTEREIENITIPIGTLNAREWEEMRAHVVESESFLSRIPWSEDLRNIPTIAGAHHEKLDGSGYPKGLQGEAISVQARILTIADIYDACTAWDRPYCQPISISQTVALLQKEARETKLDVDLVHLFISAVLPEVKHLAPRG